VSTREPDVEKTLDLMKHVYGFLEGWTVSAMVWVGDALGLYAAMRDAGGLTAPALAARTGLHERWLLEWLRGQAAAGLVDHVGDERFALSPEQAAVLADEQGSVFFSAGSFSGMPDRAEMLRRLPESFRTGIGFPFDAHGTGGAQLVERMFAPWFRHMLVPVVLGGIDGLVPRLQAGAKAADVGCGAGVALVTMAKDFPASEFHGYDISKLALARAETHKREAGVENLEFHDVAGEALPADASFDLVTAFDCIHDMTHPAEVIAAVRRALRDDGLFLLADIKSYPTLEENIERNPMVAMMYASSVLSCMASATSEPGGAGLGTLGFHTDLAREMAGGAGFTRFEVRDFGHPVNLYYEIRP
jgi:2-polyprenyl-3-methyl-5-hydroxy-6-metoxy-1,4-benzoquinol methylase